MPATEFRIEHDADLGLMVICQSGRRDRSTIGLNTGYIARAFREYRPRGVLVRLQDMVWDLDEADWREHAEDQVRLVPPGVPLAVAPAGLMSRHKRAVLQERIYASGKTISLFESVEEAVTWLVAAADVKRRAAS